MPPCHVFFGPGCLGDSTQIDWPSTGLLIGILIGALVSVFTIYMMQQRYSLHYRFIPLLVTNDFNITSTVVSLKTRKPKPRKIMEDPSTGLPPLKTYDFINVVLEPTPSKFHFIAMQVPQNSLSAPSHLQNDILIWGSIHQLHGHSCFLFASAFHLKPPRCDFRNQK